MSGLTIAEDDPRPPEIVAVLDRHLAHAHAWTPAGQVFALDLDGLCAPAVTFVSARRGGEVLGIGALKELDPRHGELKSMHTIEEARGQGVAAALVGHLVDLARSRGYERVSLETGSQDAFAPARALYLSLGFEPCGPFAAYEDVDTSAFLSRGI